MADFRGIMKSEFSVFSVTAMENCFPRAPWRRPRRWGIALVWPMFLALGPLLQNASRGAETHPLVSRWLSAQTNLQTWAADVTQIRSLKTLAQPLTAQGKVWFAAPNRFRWEILTPSQTIAVRQPDQVLVIYPRLKRAERYPLQGAESGAWKDALSLLEAGFPRSAAELEARFRILSQSVSGEDCDLILQPRSGTARRLLPQIKVTFATNDFALRATELQFGDGSTLRNEFHHPRINPKLEEDLFTPRLESDFKLVEPMKK